MIQRPRRPQKAREAPHEAHNGFETHEDQIGAFGDAVKVQVESDFGRCKKFRMCEHGA